MSDIIVRAYSEYDVTVFADGFLTSHEQRAQLMRFCDYSVLTLSPDAEKFEDELSSWQKFMDDYAVPFARMRAVAWGYVPDESADKEYFEKIGGEKFLGVR